VRRIRRVAAAVVYFDGNRLLRLTAFHAGPVVVDDLGCWCRQAPGAADRRVGRHREGFRRVPAAECPRAVLVFKCRGRGVRRIRRVAAAIIHSRCFRKSRRLRAVHTAPAVRYRLGCRSCQPPGAADRRVGRHHKGRRLVPAAECPRAVLVVVGACVGKRRIRRVAAAIFHSRFFRKSRRLRACHAAPAVRYRFVRRPDSVQVIIGEVIHADFLAAGKLGCCRIWIGCPAGERVASAGIGGFTQQGDFRVVGKIIFSDVTACAAVGVIGQRGGRSVGTPDRIKGDNAVSRIVRTDHHNAAGLVGRARAIRTGVPAEEFYRAFGCGLDSGLCTVGIAGAVGRNRAGAVIQIIGNMEAARLDPVRIERNVRRDRRVEIVRLAILCPTCENVSIAGGVGRLGDRLSGRDRDVQILTDAIIEMDYRRIGLRRPFGINHYVAGRHCGCEVKRGRARRIGIPAAEYEVAGKSRRPHHISSCEIVTAQRALVLDARGAMRSGVAAVPGGVAALKLERVAVAGEADIKIAVKRSAIICKRCIPVAVVRLIRGNRKTIIFIGESEVSITNCLCCICSCARISAVEILFVEVNGSVRRSGFVEIQ